MSSQDSQTYHWHFATELNDNHLEIHGRAIFFMIVLFAVIILIILLFLYARWVCHYQQHHFPSNPPVHMPHALPLSSQGPFRSTLVKGIPITLYQTSSSENTTVVATATGTECCICLGIFADGEKVKVLPNCNHCFHSECVDKWLTAHSSCPLCRASLNSQSAVISILTE